MRLIIILASPKSHLRYIYLFFLPVERDISSLFLCSFQNRSLRLKVILQPCEPWINDIRKSQLGLHMQEVIIFKSSNFRLTALHKYFQDSFFAWSPNSSPLFLKMISVSVSENSWLQGKVFCTFLPLACDHLWTAEQTTDVNNTTLQN